ncbi:MAG: hypothetical protein ETSY2_41915 [Candidatus Entotheonella gemina]|uniref:Type II toxin-antitoxin system PemK/MazF family toxin n=1 Tax=Candidatus Entotheonella gemina TaxID=1429439 RepID=W4LLS0_9BACT|nr:MAG: hypothetical protein ETSY2_41915 [Candidatus Entotheonella gemina]
MRRGEVYDARLDPTVGSEQAGSRPVVIVSRDAINASIGEVAKDLALLDDHRRKRELQIRLQVPERDDAALILQVDRETAHIWSELTASARKNGRIVLVSDGLIAATPRRHGLHVMTRNVADFGPTGTMLANPWGDK